jgi:predicted DNA-binding transcriptional regulator AlpA
MPEILTVTQLAEYLQMTARQIYSMCEERTRTGKMKHNPLPKLKINGKLRFARVDVEAWLARERQAA